MAAGPATRSATSGAVARHQVQEASVHRWDIEAATGPPAPLDAAVADDGVSELLEVILGTAASGVPGTVQLVATDTDSRWTIAGEGAGDEPGCVVRGSASDLVGLLYRRVAPTALSVDGDGSLLDALLAAAYTD